VPEYQSFDVNDLDTEVQIEYSNQSCECSAGGEMPRRFIL
jgi:hypothetical protein